MNVSPLDQRLLWAAPVLGPDGSAPPGGWRTPAPQGAVAPPLTGAQETGRPGAPEALQGEADLAEVFRQVSHTFSDVLHKLAELFDAPRVPLGASSAPPDASSPAGSGYDQLRSLSENLHGTRLDLRA